jgi:hypothetical protein
MPNSFAKGDKNYKRSEQETLKWPTGLMTFFQLTGSCLTWVLRIIFYLYEAESSLLRALRVLLRNLFLPFADLIPIYAHDYFSHGLLWVMKSLLLPILLRVALLSHPSIRMYITQGHNNVPISVKLNKATLHSILLSHFHLIGIMLRTCLSRVGA